MPREAMDGRSGDLQEVQAENCSCIFCTPIIPDGRMPREAMDDVQDVQVS